MEVPLPSGGSATFRDQLLRGDIRSARKSMVFVIGPDGTQRRDASFIDTVTGQLIRQMLVAWPLGEIPGNATSAELAERMLDALPDADYEALEKAVGPWVERVMRLNRPTGTALTHVATGIQVEAATPEDAARLAETGDFAREGQEADPKPGSRPTGTSSSAGPGLTAALPPGPEPEPDPTQSISS